MGCRERERERGRRGERKAMGDEETKETELVEEDDEHERKQEKCEK